MTTTPKVRGARTLLDQALGSHLRPAGHVRVRLAGQCRTRWSLIASDHTRNARTITAYRNLPIAGSGIGARGGGASWRWRVGTSGDAMAATDGTSRAREFSPRSTATNPANAASAMAKLAAIVSDA